MNGEISKKLTSPSSLQSAAASSASLPPADRTKMNGEISKKLTVHDILGNYDLEPGNRSPS